MNHRSSLPRYRPLFFSNPERDRAAVKRSFLLPRFLLLSTSRAIIILVLSLVCSAAQAQTVILHLKNGDRIAGTIVSEDTNRVVIATTWIKELPVPLSEIASREKVPAEAKPPAAPTPAAPPQKAAAPPIITNTGPSVLPSARAGTPVAMNVP